MNSEQKITNKMFICGLANERRHDTCTISHWRRFGSTIDKKQAQIFVGKTHWLPGGRLNKKDGLTRYGDSHVKDKTS